MAGPGPICSRCHDDRWRLSEREWCEDCEATDVPPTTFTPDGDGSRRVRCVDCDRRVPSDQAHLVKANNTAGQAHRCEDCGQAAHRSIVAYHRVSNHQRKLKRVPLSSFTAGDLLDPEPIPPMAIQDSTRRSSLRGRPIPRRGHGASEGDPSL